MKTMTALDAMNRFGQLVEAAQREPVFVTKQGRPTVVVMSAEDYQRRRLRAWKGLLKTLDGTAAHAAAEGLTETELDRLLADGE